MTCVLVLIRATSRILFYLKKWKICHLKLLQVLDVMMVHMYCHATHELNDWSALGLIIQCTQRCLSLIVQHCCQSLPPFIASHNSTHITNCTISCLLIYLKKKSGIRKEITKVIVCFNTTVHFWNMPKSQNCHQPDREDRQQLKLKLMRIWTHSSWSGNTFLFSEEGKWWSSDSLFCISCRCSLRFSHLKYVLQYQVHHKHVPFPCQNSSTYQAWNWMWLHWYRG